MKWTTAQAKELGLFVISFRYATFRISEAIRFRGHPMVTDLDKGKLISNNLTTDAAVEALNFPRFETLKELLVWLRIQT